jgi:hypothetical protein
VTAAPKISEAALNAMACESLAPILNQIVDYKGFASPEVTALGGPDAPQMRLREYRVGPHGDWRNLGDGATGKDLIELVVHLGSCDRGVAAEFLQRLVARQEAA